jgi:hypothetical protein
LTEGSFENSNTLGSVDPVWYIKESGKATFPSWIPEEKWIVMVTQLYSAYLDESGTHEGSDAVVVAGFISNAVKWQAFSQGWKAALDDWQIPMFHMSDYENRQDSFKSWNGQERKERLNRLLGLIKQHTFDSIAFAVLKKSFDEIFSDKAKRICGDAYGLASIGCWHKLALRAREPQIDGFLAYIMETGSKGSSALTRIYGKESKNPGWTNDTRILSLSFQDKRFFLPLQAADILAYEIFKQIHRQFGGDQRSTRYPLKQLYKFGRQWHYADDDELKRINEYLTNLPDDNYKV